MTLGDQAGVAGPFMGAGPVHDGQPDGARQRAARDQPALPDDRQQHGQPPRRRGRCPSITNVFYSRRRRAARRARSTPRRCRQLARALARARPSRRAPARRRRRLHRVPVFSARRARPRLQRALALRPGARRRARPRSARLPGRRAARRPSSSPATSSTRAPSSSPRRRRRRRDRVPRPRRRAPRVPLVVLVDRAHGLGRRALRGLPAGPRPRRRRRRAHLRQGHRADAPPGLRRAGRPLRHRGDLHPAGRRAHRGPRRPPRPRGPRCRGARSGARRGSLSPLPDEVR